MAYVEPGLRIAVIICVSKISETSVAYVGPGLRLRITEIILIQGAHSLPRLRIVYFESKISQFFKI